MDALIPPIFRPQLAPWSLMERAKGLAIGKCERRGATGQTSGKAGKTQD